MSWFYQRRKYRFSQLHKYQKSICAFFRQTPMCEILGQPHWCSQNSISRIKILISNPSVQNMKTCPKSLNYRYAGFQILDWNSNSQLSLVRTTDKLLQIFTHKDLFTIKNFIHKNIVYYCCLSCAWHNPLSIQRVSAFPFLCQCLFNSLLPFFFSLFTFCTIPSYPFFFSLPHYDTILHIAVINFSLGITHFF